MGRTSRYRAKRDATAVADALHQRCDSEGRPRESNWTNVWIPLPEDFDYGQLRYQCAECGATEASLCSGCRKIRYCGRECQSTAWKRAHKHVCNTPDQLDFPRKKVIEKANFHQLTVLVDEWFGCWPNIGTMLGHHLSRNPPLVINASNKDLMHMARLIASVLEAEEIWEENPVARLPLPPVW